MPSEWRVTCNPIDGEYLYRVYRLRDVNATDHSGNREFHGSWTADKATAEAAAKKLNEEV